jgi:hypothetical protein
VSIVLVGPLLLLVSVFFVDVAGFIKVVIVVLLA